MSYQRFYHTLITDEWYDYWRDQFGDYQARNTNSTTTTLDLNTEEIISYVANQTGLQPDWFEV